MVKVETQRDPRRGILAIAFEASRPEDLDVLDEVRTAMLGEFEKTGGYVGSNRFVLHIKVSDAEAAMWAEAGV